MRKGWRDGVKRDAAKAVVVNVASKNNCMFGKANCVTALRTIHAIHSTL
jgi:hypothetical protein